MPAVSPNPSSFAVEEYLIATCGLTRPQAVKASPKFSHLKLPTNPDVVLAFLAGLGLSTVMSQLLLPRTPSSSTPASREPCNPPSSGSPTSVSHVPTSHASSRSPECGLGACDIAKLCLVVPWLLSSGPKRVHAMVACAKGLGVLRRSGMFRQALQAVAFSDKKKIAAKLEFLKKTFRWSHAEVGIVVSKAPGRRSEFLISKVGLEPAYIVYRPAMLMYSLEGRIRPRYYVVKFLKENGLIDHNRGFFNTVMVREKHGEHPKDGST
ncbi:hypothetical protein VPH35_115242 [Triticum aestivum]|uniref:Uncharacterized protein n=1 Tax=Aegilops tauschii TaxID=37682 RepID=R7WGD0_AEGTA